MCRFDLQPKLTCMFSFSSFLFFRRRTAGNRRAQRIGQRRDIVVDGGVARSRTRRRAARRRLADAAAVGRQRCVWRRQLRRRHCNTDARVEGAPLAPAQRQRRASACLCVSGFVFRFSFASGRRSVSNVSHARRRATSVVAVGRNDDESLQRAAERRCAHVVRCLARRRHRTAEVCCSLARSISSTHHLRRRQCGGECGDSGS